MSRDWKKWMTDRGLQKWFQRDNLIIMVLVGILLVIIALPTKEDTKKDPQSPGTEAGKDSAGLTGGGQPDASGAGEKADGAGGDGALEAARDTEEYAGYLEQRLSETLSQMSGVGDVKVMITLKSSSELVVEKEQPVSRSTTNENDSQGGSRIVSQMESEENTVYRKEGNNSEPYVVKTLPPQIEGVVVVAEGAGSGTVNRTIVEIVQALFGIEAHKVKVVKMVADG